MNKLALAAIALILSIPAFAMDFDQSIDADAIRKILIQSENIIPDVKAADWKEPVSIKVTRGNPDSPEAKAFILESGPAFSVRGIVAKPLQAAQIRVLNTTFEGKILKTSDGLLFTANDGHEEYRFSIKLKSKDVYFITGYVPSGSGFFDEDLKVTLAINNQGYTLKNAKIALAADSKLIEGWVYKDNSTNAPKFLAMLTAISEIMYALNGEEAFAASLSPAALSPGETASGAASGYAVSFE